MTLAAGGSDRRRQKEARETSRASDAAPQAIAATEPLRIDRPIRPTTRLPTSGMTGINQIMVRSSGFRVSRFGFRGNRGNPPLGTRNSELGTRNYPLRRLMSSTFTDSLFL